MTKRERLEDLGILYVKLEQMLDKDIFLFADSKHGFEDWKRCAYDKVEYGEIHGLEGLFTDLRYLKANLEMCMYLAKGSDYDD